MADLALRYFVSLKSAFLLLLHIKNKTPEKSGGSSAVWNPAVAGFFIWQRGGALYLLPDSGIRQAGCLSIS